MRLLSVTKIQEIIDENLSISNENVVFCFLIFSKNVKNCVCIIIEDYSVKICKYVLPYVYVLILYV